MRLPAIFIIYYFREINIVDCCQYSYIFLIDDYRKDSKETSICIAKCFTNASVCDILVISRKKR